MHAQVFRVHWFKEWALVSELPKTYIIEKMIVPPSSEDSENIRQSACWFFLLFDHLPEHRSHICPVGHVSSGPGQGLHKVGAL